MISPKTSLFQLFKDPAYGKVYKWHHYLEVYESFFQKFCGKPLVILEIGILDGGSLRLWRNYFGDQCQVYGVDINPLAKQYEETGIHIRIGDQSDPNFLAQLIKEVGHFDIVIDDGAHTNFMVRSSFIALYSKTRHLYVVEDTQALYWYGGIYSLARDCVYAFTGQRGLLVKAKRLTKILILWFSGRLSFIAFAKRRADDLTAQWHKKPYSEMRPGQLREISDTGVSEFAKSTTAVHFYDSLVIFEKYPQIKKVVEFR
jgi:hypothetical protein